METKNRTCDEEVSVRYSQRANPAEGLHAASPVITPQPSCRASTRPHRVRRSWVALATASSIAVWMLLASTPSRAQVTSFQLTSGVSGTLPFTVGLGFKKSDVPNVPALDNSTGQVIVKSRWSDNSVKHAIASGHAALTAGVARTITVSSSSAPSGTN